jgi:hypothetical protein
MFCTSCGAKVPADSNFCGLCGAKITTPVAAQSADTSNTDAPARTRPEAVQSADTSNIDFPAEPKPQTVPLKKKEKAQARTEKKGWRGRGSLIVFIVVGLLVALPASWLFADLGPGVSGGAAFLVTFAIAISATWIYEKFVYRPPGK